MVLLNTMSSDTPHFLPYQGSKRKLAPMILAQLPKCRFRRLFEPFGGSGAMSLAAAKAGIADRIILGDSLIPLAQLWEQVLTNPLGVSEAYRANWLLGQQEPAHYLNVRAEYNRSQDPDLLFWLLVRCTKNSPRWNHQGLFNQGADPRRTGTHPDRMEKNLLDVAAVLKGRTEIRYGDFRQQLLDAESSDLVYLDPPWQGTSEGRNPRYHAGLSRNDLLEALQVLDERRVPWVLSYDGKCGMREYGEPLPTDLHARLVELDAGRSSQASLVGRNEKTVESLWLSRHVGQ